MNSITNFDKQLSLLLSLVFILFFIFSSTANAFPVEEDNQSVSTLKENEEKNTEKSFSFLQETGAASNKLVNDPFSFKRGRIFGRPSNPSHPLRTLGLSPSQNLMEPRRLRQFDCTDFCRATGFDGVVGGCRCGYTLFVKKRAGNGGNGTPVYGPSGLSLPHPPNFPSLDVLVDFM